MNLSARILIAGFRSALGLKEDSLSLQGSLARLRRTRDKNLYFSIPCWATAMLSRVEFLTIYIISSAWRMISWELLASSG